MASVASGVLLLAQAVVLASLIADPGQWRRHVAEVVAVFALRALTTYVTDVATARAAARIVPSLRERVLLSEAPGQVGARTTLATRGVRAVEPYLTRYVPAVALGAVLPPLTVLAIFFYDTWSGLIVLLTLPLVPVFAALVGMATRDRADRQWRAMAGLSGHFLDVVRGLPTLVAFDRAEAQVPVIRRVTDRYRRASAETLRLAFASSAVLELVATLSVAMVAVNVGLRLAEGSLDLFTALVVLLLAPEAYWPLRRMGAEFHAAAEGIAVFEQVEALPPLPRTGDVAPATRPGKVQLDDVSFTWPGATAPVLDDLDFTFAPRAITAVVGPSGAGKTTLIRLLLGELQPTRGEIRGLPDRVAQAPQRPWLVRDTIAANLRLGRPDASDDDLWHALAAVSLTDAVTVLPEALATDLGDDGAGLSAGQRARLSLARIVLADRDVVILDEPTAHLDAESEQIMVATLGVLAERATVIVVAHAEAVVQAADTVLRVPARPRVSPVIANDDSAAPVVTPTVAATENTSAAGATSSAVVAEVDLTDEPLRWGSRTGITLGVLSAASGVALTATAGWLIARAAEHPPVLTLMVAIVGVRLFGIGRPVLRYAERLISHDVALRTLAERRASVYAAVVPLVPGALGLRRGDVLASLVDDVDAELDRSLRVRLPLITAAAVALGTVAFAAWHHPLAGLLMGGVVALSALAWPMAGHRARIAENEFVASRAELSGQVEELHVAGAQPRHWQATSHFLDRIAAVGGRESAAVLLSGRGVATAKAWVLIVVGLGTAALGVALSGATTTGPEFAIRALLLLLPLALLEVLLPIADAAASAARVRSAEGRLDVLTSATPLVSDPEVAAPPPVVASVAGRDLSAAWGERPALTHVDLTLGVGERVGVVGPSGCGKSTLAALVLRFLDPSAGTLNLGGVALRDLDLSDVRARVGLVDDEPHVFSSTVAENIRLARPGASDEEVADAVRRAHLGEWLDALPRGLHTFVGEGHRDVSGGERARLAIARSLLADQPVLVLDEPTAHLDHDTAEAIAAEVFALEASVLWITHGRVGLDRVDRVLELSTT